MKKIYLLLGIALLWCCFLNVNVAQAQTVPVNNYAENGDFEDGFLNGSRWFCCGDANNPTLVEWGIESENPISGTRSARMEMINPGTANWNAMYENFFTVHKDVPIKLSFKMKASAPTAFGIELAQAYPNYAALHREGGIAVGTDVQTYEFIVTPTVSDPNFKVGFLLGQVDAGVTLWIDDVVVEETDGAWDGNIVANGSFEEATLATKPDPNVRGGWALGSNVSVDASSKLTGANSMKVVSSATDSLAHYLQADAGKLYTLSFDVVASEAVAFTAALDRREGSTGEFLSHTVNATTTSQTVTVNTTKALDAMGLHKLIFKGFPAGGAEVWIDNVSLVAMPECLDDSENFWHKVGDGSWTNAANIVVEEGQTVKFGPHPTRNHTWTWKGPNGWTAEGREPTTPPITAETAGEYTAIYTANDGSCAGTMTYLVQLPELINPADVNIVFVAKPLVEGAPETNDDEQIAWLRGLGFNVETYYNATLSTAPQADIDMLNAADLVIIGRSGSSGDFGGDQKAAWNALTAPVILNSNWMARTTRLNWFTHDASPVHVDEIGTVINALIEAPNDPVFSNVTLDANNTMPWTVTPDDFFFTTGATNGTVLAVTSDTDPAGAKLFVRFDANQEFYPGSVDMPAAERVYFTFGNDHANDETGADIINFFPLTAEARQVYLDEINRIVGTTVELSNDATLSGVTLNVGDITFDPATTVYDVVLPTGTTTVNVDAAATDANATVTGTGAVDVSSGSGVATIEVTAADGTLQTYTINFTVKEASNVATLSGITLSEGSIAFDPATTVYDVALPTGTTTVNVDAAATDANATVTGTGAVDVSSGTGTATIVVTAEDGVTTETYTINFNAPTGIADLASAGVRIFPNPVNGSSALTLDGAADIVAVNVYNAQGVLVRSITADSNASVSIQVAELANGVYLIKAVKKDRSVLSGKFVK